mmetsp:Transcript_19848/g.79092  ORF Transcript_19848/g.79092 Transcript_19848/m.79092 type:complete len:178 (-) Transcript_19848:2214-2747(-)
MVSQVPRWPPRRPDGGSDDAPPFLGLAPMVRANSTPLRALALHYGADVVFSEELIAKRLAQCERRENAGLGTVDFVHATDGTTALRVYKTSAVITKRDSSPEPVPTNRSIRRSRRAGWSCKSARAIPRARRRRRGSWRAIAWASTSTWAARSGSRSRTAWAPRCCATPHEPRRSCVR